MFTAQHKYLTIHGDYFDGLEQWQFGVRLSDGGVSSEATALACAPLVEEWWRGVAYPSGEQIQAPASARLTEVKVATVGADGSYPANEVAYSHFYIPPIVGRTSNEARPYPQIAICVTLTTALPRGYASKGRIYLPALAETVPEVDGRMSTTHASTIAKSVRTLISRINGETLIGNVQVMSKGRAERTPNAAGTKIIYTYPNPGATQLVTGTRCGRVADTQRRRRRSLTESPEAAAL